MPTRWMKIILWLFVIDLGIAFGAGLSEHRIVFPRWLSVATDGGLHWNADAVRLDNSGLRFWAYVTTGPLTILTVANLWVAWSYTHRWLRLWWVGASAVSLVERVLTLAYFVPTMIGLMNAPDTIESVATASRWSELNYVRHSLTLAAWLLALQAFAIAHRAVTSPPDTVREA
jgi:hypothetical protein